MIENTHSVQVKDGDFHDPRLKLASMIRVSRHPSGWELEKNFKDWWSESKPGEECGPHPKGMKEMMKQAEAVTTQRLGLPCGVGPERRAIEDRDKDARQGSEIQFANVKKDRNFYMWAADANPEIWFTDDDGPRLTEAEEDLLRGVPHIAGEDGQKLGSDCYGIRSFQQDEKGHQKQTHAHLESHATSKNPKTDGEKKHQKPQIVDHQRRMLHR